MKIIKNQNSFKYKKINYLDYKLFSNQIILKFNDLCEIVRGGSPRPIQEYITNSENDTPWLKIRDATSVCKYIEKTKEFIKKDGEKYSRIVNPGDFIVSNSATPGIPRIMNIRACIHDGWLLLNNINEKIIKKDYMFYMFYMIKHQLENQGQGSIFKNLSKDILGNFEIKINVDIKQQERIAHILSMQEEQIERIKGLIKKLEKRNQYYAEKLLSGELRIRENAETGETEFYENKEWQEVVFGCDIIKKKRRFPIEWKKDKLLNNIKLTKGISINSSKFNYENKGFQFLRTGDVWEDASSKKIPAFYDDKIEDKFFKNKYDYISCFEGFNKIPKKGTIGLVTNNGVGIISSHLYKTENMKINGKYIAVSLLNLSYIQDILMKNAIGSTVLSSTKCLKDIEFLFPDKEESIKIEKILSNLFKEVEILKELLPKEEKRFQWMLDNLLSGEYEVVED